jgi:cobyrinic acid a,c-diamide synthase
MGVGIPEVGSRLNCTPRPCPALLVSAPASGQGKTTVTAALARYHIAQGRRVQVFKTGPDFIDPMILEVASGHAVYQLDLWMVGEAECRRLLYAAAQEADLIFDRGRHGPIRRAPLERRLGRGLWRLVLAIIDSQQIGNYDARQHHGATSRCTRGATGIGLPGNDRGK